MSKPDSRLLLQTTVAAVGVGGTVVGIVTDLGLMWTIFGLLVLVAFLLGLVVLDHRGTAQAEAQVARLRRQIALVTRDNHQSAYDLELSTKLIIDERHPNDKWVLTRVTSVVGEAPCHWIRVFFSCPRGRTDDKEFSVKLLPTNAGSSEPNRYGELVTIEQDLHRWEGVVLFDPPIREGYPPVKWCLEVVWPHFADDYRKDGAASISFRSPLHAETAQCEVVVTGQRPGRRVGIEKTSPPLGLTSVTPHPDRTVLHWRVDHPATGVEHTLFYWVMA